MTTPPIHSTSPIHNTFSIPRPRRLRAPDREIPVHYEADWPLNPWLVQGHAHLYAPVDDIEEQVRRFEEEGPSPEDLLDLDGRTGHLIVVSGDSGAGKTSLLNRCVASLVDRLGEYLGTPPDQATAPWRPRMLPPNVRIVTIGGFENKDTSFANHNGKRTSLPETNLRIYQDIWDTLHGNDPDPRFRDAEFRRRWAELQVTDHEERDLRAQYAAMHQVLEDMNINFMVIVPYLPWPGNPTLGQQFLRSCFDYSKPSITFFVESANPDVEQDIDRAFNEWERRRVVHLRAGRLNSDDDVKFLRQRHAHGLPHPGENPNGQPHRRTHISESAIRARHPEIPCDRVRHLQELCFNLSKEGIESGEVEIGEARVRAYRPARRDLRRSSRPGSA